MCSKKIPDDFRDDILSLLKEFKYLWGMMLKKNKISLYHRT